MAGAKENLLGFQLLIVLVIILPEVPESHPSSVTN